MRSLVEVLHDDLAAHPTVVARSSIADLSRLGTLTFLASLRAEAGAVHEWAMLSESSAAILPCLSADTLSRIGEYLSDLPGFDPARLCFENQESDTFVAHEEARSSVLGYPRVIAKRLISVVTRKPRPQFPTSSVRILTLIEQIEAIRGSMLASSALRGSTSQDRLDLALRIARMVFLNRSGVASKQFKILVVSDRENVDDHLGLYKDQARRIDVSCVTFNNFILEDHVEQPGISLSSEDAVDVLPRHAHGYDFVILHDCMTRDSSLSVLPTQYRDQGIGLIMTGPLDHDLLPGEDVLWAGYSKSVFLTLASSRVLSIPERLPVFRKMLILVWIDGENIDKESGEPSCFFQGFLGDDLYSVKSTVTPVASSKYREPGYLEGLLRHRFSATKSDATCIAVRVKESLYADGSRETPLGPGGDVYFGMGFWGYVVGETDVRMEPSVIEERQAWAA